MTWTPPPPGSTDEQLPEDVLALIPIDPYLSTACQTALRLEEAASRAVDEARGGDVSRLLHWAHRLHARCRLNNKFTGQMCACHRHQEQP